MKEQDIIVRASPNIPLTTKWVACSNPLCAEKHICEGFEFPRGTQYVEVPKYFRDDQAFCDDCQPPY